MLLFHGGRDVILGYTLIIPDVGAKSCEQAHPGASPILYTTASGNTYFVSKQVWKDTLSVLRQIEDLHLPGEVATYGYRADASAQDRARLVLYVPCPTVA
jgi:hypothetical protein